MLQRTDAIKNERHEAYMLAVRLLGIREHHERELREKLRQKRIDAIIIDDVIEQLKQYDYLNERRYAEAFLRFRMNKGETPWLAARKARQKGVDPSVLQLALEEAEQRFDACSACRAVLDKRDPTRQCKQDKRAWQRQLRYLQGKGYDITTILQVMNDEDDYKHENI